MDETRLNETMICNICKKLKINGPPSLAIEQCICPMPINDQLELPLETSETFKNAWSDYRNGQRTMLHSVLTFLNSSGYDTVAEKVRKHFVDSQNG